MNVNRGRHCVHELGVHLVFVTGYRREVFTAPMLTRCEEIMRDVCASFEVDLIESNGGDDHVHLLVNIPSKVALSVLVNSLKSVSARYPRKEYDTHVRKYLWGGHFWSRSYDAGSTCGANLATVRASIQGQDRPAR
ncbi:IS200/IS605 family transposase [Nonomuraea wenchangensis]|uniref:IS200/IS605 family transposase n=1 Tax=Nonomuraea wenchangensis TaxID=568860 RepID=UPI003721E944